MVTVIDILVQEQGWFPPPRESIGTADTGAIVDADGQAKADRT